MQVGFIGLGTMGSKTATSLQKAGYRLVVHDLRRDAATPHLAAGAVWADTARQVAEASDVVFTSLPAPADVEEVALGEGGLLAGMRPGGAYFDLSTNASDVVRRIHVAFAERSVHRLDAPVSGGPRGAATGKLAIWVGGEKEVFDRYQPLLDAIGDQARYVGAIGTATVAKLVHNCLGYMLNRALSEVFTLGVKCRSLDAAERNPGLSKTEKGARARSAPLCLASLSLIPGFRYVPSGLHRSSCLAPLDLQLRNTPGFDGHKEGLYGNTGETDKEENFDNKKGICGGRRSLRRCSARGR